MELEPLSLTELKKHAESFGVVPKSGHRGHRSTWINAIESATPNETVKEAVKPQLKQKSKLGLLDGIAGSINGSFFAVPRWVDVAKSPGTSSQVPTKWGSLFESVLLMLHLIYSPNLIWLAVAALMYFAFPYDFEAAQTWALGWVCERAALNLVVTMVYYGFWEVTTYFLGWSKRKFKPNSWPSNSDIIHNVWYTTLGVLQWTGWEVIFMHLYATGRLPYIADEDAFATPGNIARMIFWTAFVPVVRPIHFYFAHRFIHINALYKYVHSLHHRNVDIEPFAGLSMHPIEHMYYFSCVFPSLYCLMSPFHMLQNGVHLLLSPAASHAGWEDIMQSDQFHYIHHAKFECNYGSASFPLDNMFGTFREKIGKSEVYKGAVKGGDDKEETTITTRDTSRGSIQIHKNHRGFGLYMAFTAALMSCLCYFVALSDADTSESQARAHPRKFAALFAFGPVLFASLLFQFSADRRSISWPFHREAASKFGLHLVVGFAIAVLPVYQILLALFTAENDFTSPFCVMWKCFEGRGSDFFFGISMNVVLFNLLLLLLAGIVLGVQRL